MRVVAESLEEIAEAVRGSERVLPVGAGSKPALSGCAAEATRVDVSRVAGIVEYDPAELIVTARAGTTLSDLAEALAAHGQHLPFDPPLRSAGATLGGTIAAGLSGAGAFGAGGLRDFLCGVTVIDGDGRRFKGGGRVVKNAAGFDLQKLMIGSLGRLGIIVEASCKVFPQPPASATLAFECEALDAALAAVARLARGPVEVEALEVDPPGLVLARIAGAADLIDARVARLAAAVDAPARRLDEAQAAAVWTEAEAFAWAPADALLARVPLTPSRVPDLERALLRAGASRRYGRAANVAWVAWPGERGAFTLGTLLAELGLSGVPLIGECEAPIIGLGRWNGAFQSRLREAMDPHGRFLEAA